MSFDNGKKRDDGMAEIVIPGTGDDRGDSGYSIPSAGRGRYSGKGAYPADGGRQKAEELLCFEYDANLPCIGKVQAKPFDRSFDAQMEAAEELYGTQLRLQFDRRDVQDVLATVAELYDGPIIDRVERVLGEQMRKYKVYFR